VFSEFVPSSTSSFRVPDELKARLEDASRRMKKGKNRILTEALIEYLDRHNQDSRERVVAEAWNE
jgi:predicted transcriptional regulator